MKIKVSTGEIVDKYTILQIKLDKIQSPEKLNNVRHEMALLINKVEKIYSRLCPTTQALLQELYEQLHDINLTLWNIEDQIRESERSGDFGPDFVELARSVYYNNDERALVKSQINQLTRSNIVEEKSYQAY
jgi:hypothetical protein